MSDDDHELTEEEMKLLEELQSRVDQLTEALTAERARTETLITEAVAAERAKTVAAGPRYVRRIMMPVMSCRIEAMMYSNWR